MIIRGFFHIFLCNHWYTIVSEQLRILITSGLYDVSHAIYIGCVGSEKEKRLLEKYFTKVYPKLKIQYYSPDPKVYEFPTLQLIEQTKGIYVGYYFHTKAVTKPSETIQNHWRGWLNEAVLNQWKKHYRLIRSRYDVSSVNYIKSYNHFSGNFWWFNRDYINRLPKVSTLNWKNRYDAESWICMGKPKLFSMEFKEPGRDAFVMKRAQ